MDPYIHEQTRVLKNKLNLSDEQELVEVEAQIVIASLLNLEVLFQKIDFSSYTSLQQIHFHLFGLLYDWAGEFRTIDIYKHERVLGGASVQYTSHEQLVTELNKVYDWATSISWTHSNINITENFAGFMTKLWRIHPFREGNTRTISVFMKLFADAKGLDYNAQLIANHAAYARNALVLSAVTEAPEPQYLLKIIKDALSGRTNESLSKRTERASTYEVIKDYKMEKYEENTFYSKDENK